MQTTPCLVQKDQHLTQCGAPEGFAILWTVFYLEYDARQKVQPITIGTEVRLAVNSDIYNLRITDLDVIENRPHMFAAEAVRGDLLEQP